MKTIHLLLALCATLLVLNTQAQSDITRRLVEEIIEEKTKGITIRSSNRDNEDIGVGAEPFIHQSKFDSNLMGIAYMGTAANWELSLSNDGGSSWTLANLNTIDLLTEVQPNSQLLGGGDPNLVIDENNTIHLTFIYLFLPEGGDITNQSDFVLEVFYAYSDDFGVTWTAGESLVSGTLDQNDSGFVDRTWMDIDANQNIYCGGTHFSSNSETGDQGTIVFKKEDGNLSFNQMAETAIPVPSANAQTQFTNVVVDEMGQVHVSGILITPSSESIVYSKSDANGENYAEHIEIASSVGIPQSTEVHSRENSAASLAVDGENVYIAWSDFQDGDVLGYYVYSHDGGETFSSPISIGDLFSGDAYHIVMPCIAADDGHMVLTWHTVNKTTLEGQYIAAYSDDLGETLSSGYYNVSDDFTSFSDFGLTSFLGDYNSIKMDGSIAHIAWCDAQSSSEPRVYYTALDFNIASTSIAEIQPLSNQLELLKLYPNPAIENLNIAINNTTANSLSIQIISSEGKLISTQIVKLTQGENKIKLDTSKLPKGFYQLKMANNNGYVITKKISKL